MLERRVLEFRTRGASQHVSLERGHRSCTAVQTPKLVTRQRCLTNAAPKTVEVETPQRTERAPSCDLPQEYLQLSRGNFLEASICRLYYFSDSQKSVFSELLESMTSCRSALAALAIANILLTVVSLEESGEAGGAAILFGGLTVGDVAYWVDNLATGVLISYAIGPFARVLTSRSNQMARCFQGVNRLALVFQQLSISSVAVSTVTALEAAAKYPPLVVGASAVFFGYAVLRSGAMWWTLSRHTTNGEEVSRTLGALRDPDNSSYSQQMSLLDKAAVLVAFGYLLQYEERNTSASTTTTSSSTPAGDPANHASTPSTRSTAMSASLSHTQDAQRQLQPTPEPQQHPQQQQQQHPQVPPPGDPSYEFSVYEERLLRGLTEASSTAGLALGLQAFVTFMLTVADYGVGDLPGMVSNGINGTNKAVMAWLLFNACRAYDRALHTTGSSDVEHLLVGLGESGIAGLFASLALLSWGVTIATLAGLAIPLMDENALARALGDGLSHRSAEYIIDGLQWARAVLRAL